MKNFQTVGLQLTRNEAKLILGGYKEEDPGGGGPGFCGDRGTATQCPTNTEAKKCGPSGEVYCLETSTGLCKTYGTAVCSHA